MHGLALLRQLYCLGIRRLEEVSRGVEPTMERESALHSVRLKRDGTRAETRFGLSAKRTSPFKLAGGSVQSTTGSRGVRISGSNGSNAGYTVF